MTSRWARSVVASALLNIIAEVNESGQRRKRHVYGSGGEIGRETYQTYSQQYVAGLVFRNPITGDSTDGATDPLGGLMPPEDAYATNPNPDYFGMLGDRDSHSADADPFEPSGGCTVDGIPRNCDEVMGGLNNGSIVVQITAGGKRIQAPVQHVGVGGWVYLKSTPQYNDSQDEDGTLRTVVSDIYPWQYVGERLTEIPKARKPNHLKRAQRLIGDNYSPCRSLVFGSEIAYEGKHIPNQTQAIWILIAGLFRSPETGIISSIWAKESNFEWRPPGDHGPMQLTSAVRDSYKRNNQKPLILEGSYDLFTRPKGSPKRNLPFTGDPFANIITGGNYILWLYNVHWKGNIQGVIEDYKGETKKIRKAYYDDVMNWYPKHQQFFNCVLNGVGLYAMG